MFSVRSLLVQNDEMPQPSLDRLILTSLREEVIDLYSVDQDGSNVIVIGEQIHYLSDRDASDFLLKLLHEKGLFSNSEDKNAA